MPNKLLGLTEEQTATLIANSGPEPDPKELVVPSFVASAEAIVKSIFPTNGGEVEIPYDKHAWFYWSHACDLAEIELVLTHGQAQADAEIKAGIKNRPLFDRVRDQKMRWLVEQRLGIKLK